jgi:hypothetical protein
MDGTQGLEGATVHFSPNPQPLWNARLADGPKVLAMTDAMALTHDRRHFIDCRLVRSLSNGKELMDGLLPQALIHCQEWEKSRF